MPRTHDYQSGLTSIHANTNNTVEVAIIGAGIAGIATAYYLCCEFKKASVLLIDHRQPMSYTSAQSGDNYRNWWPHPTMTAFTNDSIDLMQRLARDTNNVFGMTDGGYVLASRRTDMDRELAMLQPGVDVEVLRDTARIRERFPALSEEITNVMHIRRGGDISGQQLGALMLERFRTAGGRRLNGEVREITKDKAYTLQVDSAKERQNVSADVVINAAGPFVQDVAGMLGVDLPVTNIFQQKIAFEDRLEAIPRDMPFSIDLDEKQLSWSEEERALLASDPEHSWLTAPMPAGTHCRPDGGARGKWVKLGWAYNDKVSKPERDLANEEFIDPQFPEIVIRGAAALLPSLTPYIDAPPVRFSHYGGYYTMTEENWPLIGPMGLSGSYVVGALSGFGSMAACAAGRLCAGWICDRDLPEYARPLSLARYDDVHFISELQQSTNKGLL